MRAYALTTFAEIRQILGRRAAGEQDLLEHLEDVEPESVYYHTHSYYMRGKYEHDRHPNDFATWVAEHVRDRVLAERLAIVDPSAVRDVEELRGALATLVEDHLSSIGFSPRALFGDPFDFIAARLVPLPAGIEVRTRAELREALRTAPAEVLYWHFFEDAFGRGRRAGSIVGWVAEDLRDARLAEALARVNPYRLHIEKLRAALLAAFDGGA